MILVVAATARELEHLDAAAILVCGIGPVEAAVATANALAARPVAAVLHVGIAGATALPTGSLVLGAESVYCDVLDPKSTIERISRIAADPGLLARAQAALPEAAVLPIATAGRVGAAAGFEVEAMEGFGVLRAAALAGVPAIELRSISNAVAESDRSRWRVEDALAALRRAVPLLVEALAA